MQITSARSEYPEANEYFIEKRSEARKKAAQTYAAKRERVIGEPLSLKETLKLIACGKWTYALIILAMNEMKETCGLNGPETSLLILISTWLPCK
jgi:hypothetical protein